MKKYTVAEFFSGCGGFSRGFVRSGRFNVVLANDIKKEALATYRFNHASKECSPAIIEGDIRSVPLVQISRQIAERISHVNDLDCLIGGPPCQGFSQMRRSEERENGKIIKFRGYSKLAHDPRNNLVLRFLEIAEHLMPKFILIENVPQMLSHGFEGRLGHLAETIVEMLEREMGYSVQVGVLNAADYGVPQLRQRAIIMASRNGRPTFPDPTHADHQNDLFVKGLRPWVTVADALLDLPDPPDAEDVLGGKEISLYKGRASAFAREMRSQKAFPFNHVTRSYNHSVLSIIREMRPGETWDAASERMQSKYKKMILATASEEMTTAAAKKQLISEGKINPVFYKRYYWSAYTRLEWEQPALTITANANFLGSGRFTHPEAMRGITMREAARLQSFDDDFRFITSADDDSDTTRIGIGMDMIGEAVPPLMAKAIAIRIADMLDSSGDACESASRALTA